MKTRGLATASPATALHLAATQAVGATTSGADVLACVQPWRQRRVKTIARTLATAAQAASGQTFPAATAAATAIRRRHCCCRPHGSVATTSATDRRSNWRLVQRGSGEWRAATRLRAPARLQGRAGRAGRHPSRCWKARMLRVPLTLSSLAARQRRLMHTNLVDAQPLWRWAQSLTRTTCRCRQNGQWL